MRTASLHPERVTAARVPAGVAAPLHHWGCLALATCVPECVSTAANAVDQHPRGQPALLMRMPSGQHRPTDSPSVAPRTRTTRPCPTCLFREKRAYCDASVKRDLRSTQITACCSVNCSHICCGNRNHTTVMCIASGAGCTPRALLPPPHAHARSGSALRAPAPAQRQQRRCTRRAARGTSTAASANHSDAVRDGDSDAPSGGGAAEAGGAPGRRPRASPSAVAAAASAPWALMGRVVQESSVGLWQGARCGSLGASGAVSGAPRAYVHLQQQQTAGMWHSSRRRVSFVDMRSIPGHPQ